eukprot:COSAG02_NODE_4103_length_5773_cov_2.269651_2_plen_176_part_00
MLTERRKLGKSSISLPPLGFGCAPIGEIYDRITDEEARVSFLSPWSFRSQSNDVRCTDAVIYRVLVSRCNCRPRPLSKERLSWECGTSMSLLRTARDSLRCASAVRSVEQPTTSVPYACHAPKCLYILRQTLSHWHWSALPCKCVLLSLLANGIPGGAGIHESLQAAGSRSRCDA